MGLTRLINIGALYGVSENNSTKIGSDLASTGIVEHAFLEFEEGKIVHYGTMDDAPKRAPEVEYDVEGGIVYPSYVDCHTHLVFAQNREDECVDRIKGLTDHEIANRGGGILNSVAKLRNMSEDDLYNDARNRLEKLIKLGTGAIEIKSGYGLNVDAELKMLRVIKRLKENSPIPIRATFLGAHAFPNEFKDDHEGYVNHIISSILPKVVEDKLADYIDAFCEEGYFNIEQTKRIVEAGNAHRIPSRLHVNQFKSFGAIQMAAKNKVLSVEHLEEMTDEDVATLSESGMFGVALPACSFFLKIPYTPARKLIEANVPFVLASDFNPGSSPTGNLSFVLSLACIYMNMLPVEALNALTINAANSMNLAEEIGSIAIGKSANVIVSKQVKSLNAIPYHFGESMIDDVFVNGAVFTTI